MNKSSTLNVSDLRWILRLLPEPIRKLLTAHPGEIFVAGGFIRDCITREPARDVDLFTQSAETAKAWALDLAGKADKLVITDNAVTVKGVRPVAQFIHRWSFPDPIQCIQSFDFTIAAAALWSDGGNWRTTCHESFYSDLAARRLVYTSPDRTEDAGGSMLRILKFYQRGYRIPLDSLGAVIARLVRGLEPKARSESGLAADIVGLLREVDPDIDPNHLSHLPSDSE